MRCARSIILSASLMLVALPVHADIEKIVNALRAAGCPGQAGGKAPLRAMRTLDAVAKQWSSGGRLRDAFSGSDYRMTHSASMHIEGTNDDAAIRGVLAANYCDTLSDPAFTEIGTYRHGKHLWIVVATPFAAPVASDARQVNARVLELVNRARARLRRCGNTSQRAVAPLKASPLLDRAALAHAKDMAQHNLFEHEGSDGSTPSQRVLKTGYRWRAVGENIAAGAATAEAVVKGWLESPGHCANIMSASFTEMGVGFAVEPKSSDGVYWSQVFASPR